MPAMHVTLHAIQRYQERVANVSAEAAKAALSTPAFDCAEDFGAPVVILPTGHKAVCKGGCVVTVLDKGMRPSAGLS